MIISVRIIRKTYHLCVFFFRVHFSLFNWLILFFFYKQDEKETAEEKEKKQSGHVKRKIKTRQTGRVLDPHLEEQFHAGKLYASISSRPGQSGRADGYILEGKELEFYLKKLQKKKEKKEKGTA